MRAASLWLWRWIWECPPPKWLEIYRQDRCICVHCPLGFLIECSGDGRNGQKQTFSSLRLEWSQGGGLGADLTWSECKNNELGRPEKQGYGFRRVLSSSQNFNSCLFPSLFLIISNMCYTDLSDWDSGIAVFSPFLLPYHTIPWALNLSSWNGESLAPI